MIQAEFSASAMRDLASRLETRASKAGEAHAIQIAKTARQNGHRWRSARSLWPDLAREKR